jgi:hypothetical protein
VNIRFGIDPSSRIVSVAQCIGLAVEHRSKRPDLNIFLPGFRRPTTRGVQSLCVGPRETSCDFVSGLSTGNSCGLATHRGNSRTACSPSISHKDKSREAFPSPRKKRRHGVICMRRIGLKICPYCSCSDVHRSRIDPLPCFGTKLSMIV